MSQAVSLTTALTAARVRVHAPLTSQKKIFEEIAQLCALPGEEQAFFESLLEREKLGSTYLGYGVALPHARIKALSAPVAAFLTLDVPMGYDDPNDRVDLIFGLFVPQDQHELHLQLLSKVAQRLSEETVRQALRQATSAEHILEILAEKTTGKSNLAS